ncbi:hypothetical protein SD70_00990 [Gordoniibacillus kamchatkensis]|uniref:Methyltransferase domain-containing protein n=1 Tax=Gordoniibacillus kamchatkensis TaxID=1590651 RepID=A0ABR5ANA2_9BACL|nr:class I SAM-dependent methyltransferase [Paenibacillus sp. VKM B-2647]KIL42497.1 hypothetical protein SD70_00990 [Paenibacillus sp. VKM B-2647]
MEFHKDLSALGWEKVRKRQLLRLPIVDEWLKLIRLQPGDSVLDIGPGPGLFTLRYADEVGDAGKVTALEKSKEAAEYLLQELSRIHSKIEVFVGDAAETDLKQLGSFDVIMLTDILHHADSPNQLLQNLKNTIPSSGTRIFISEFDPESNGEFGPPLEKRLSDTYLLDLLRIIGFTVIASGKQSFEHYYIIAHI